MKRYKITPGLRMSLLDIGVLVPVLSLTAYRLWLGAYELAIWSGLTAAFLILCAALFTLLDDLCEEVTQLRTLILRAIQEEKKDKQ